MGLLFSFGIVYIMYRLTVKENRSREEKAEIMSLKSKLSEHEQLIEMIFLYGTEKAKEKHEEFKKACKKGNNEFDTE